MLLLVVSGILVLVLKPYFGAQDGGVAIVEMLLSLYIFGVFMAWAVVYTMRGVKESKMVAGLAKVRFLSKLVLNITAVGITIVLLVFFLGTFLT